MIDKFIAELKKDGWKQIEIAEKTGLKQPFISEKRTELRKEGAVSYAPVLLDGGF